MWELKVVRERRVGYGPGRQILDAAGIYAAFRERFEGRDREEFLAVLLDGKGRILGFNVVSVGTLTASLVHPREVFKAAILANAASVVLVHYVPRHIISSGLRESSDLRATDVDGRWRREHLRKP